MEVLTKLNLSAYSDKPSFVTEGSSPVNFSDVVNGIHKPSKRRVARQLTRGLAAHGYQIKRIEDKTYIIDSADVKTEVEVYGKMILFVPATKKWYYRA